MTDEELANFLLAQSMYALDQGWAFDSRQFREAAARLRARSEDTERLDFLAQHPVPITRAAIDSARKRGE